MMKFANFFTALNLIIVTIILPARSELITYEPGKCCDGYTLYSVSSADAAEGQRAALVDMNGNIIHEWSITGFPAKMLPGGSLLGSKNVRATPEDHDLPYQDTIEFIQESWNGLQEWSFSNWDNDGTGEMMSRQHHDFQREGGSTGYYAPGQAILHEGKTLILAHLNKLVETISDKAIQDDVIYEVDWNGNFTGFEWHAADHFEEFGFDSSAKADIYANPRYDEDKGAGDWLHINSMSVLGYNHWYEETGDERFNPKNIIIDSRHGCFVAIINRETGKVVWRIGPDFSTGKPEYNLGQFVGQHHVHIIPKGLPGAGNIMAFDNGGIAGYGGTKGYPRYKRGYSRVIEFNPVTYEKVWEYGTGDGENIFSPLISSTQRLPNGNTLITEGLKGRIFEVTPDKEIVWEYVSPSIDKTGSNSVYRSYRIPPEWMPEGVNPGNYANWGVQEEIQLYQGWNFISSSVDLIDNSVKSVLASIKGLYNSIWTYDSDSDNWKCYIPDNSSTDQDLNIIEPGKGYLINMKEDAKLILAGKQANNSSIHLKPGWNLTGYNSQTEHTIQTALSSIEGKYTAVFTYDNQSRNWLKYIIGNPYSGNNLNVMKPNTAYWIFVTDECQWNILP